MAKRKSKSKARRSQSKPPRIPRDPVTGQQFIFDPVTGKPTYRCPPRAPEPPPTPEQIAARRERVRQRLARDEARRAAFKAREARRPREMQDDGYTLPADVWAFLRRFHNEPTFYSGEEQIGVEKARELAEAAYMEGCRQGFIEGRVLDLEPKRQRSAKANAAKRQKPREHNGMRYTLDQRDAAIVAEYAVLRPMMGATDAQYRLAEKYDLTDKMIRIIVGKANRAAR